MSLNRSRDRPTNSVPPGSGARDVIPDAALDAIAAILRVLAEAQPPDSEAAAHLEAWARHILVLSVPPGAQDAASSPRRDWSGVRRQVVTHVREERAAVSRSAGELRETVWMVVERVSQAIIGDSAADTDAAGQLERLRAAAVDSSPEELRAAALETVERLSEIIDERSARQLELARELGERVDSLKVELEDSRREADIDPLTRVWNRAVLQRELERAIQIRTLIDEPACLALVDIDHFKQVNDVHGHKLGDAALETVASALVRCFPRRTDVVTRLGGDEFAVVLPSAASADVSRLAERFLAAVRETEVPGAQAGLRLTVSIGLAEVLRGELPADCLARADRALYNAKAAGRDRISVAVDEPLERWPAAPVSR